MYGYRSNSDRWAIGTRCERCALVEVRRAMTKNGTECGNGVIVPRGKAMSMAMRWRGERAGPRHVTTSTLFVAISATSVVLQ